jgi:hypothetical protein
MAIVVSGAAPWKVVFRELVLKVFEIVPVDVDEIFSPMT